MVQKLAAIESESELRKLQDELYKESQDTIELGKKPKFQGLLEVMKSEATILTAIHNIKGNKGSNTPGTDAKTIRNILQNKYDDVIEYVKANLEHYTPLPIRRTYIPKANKKEKRPLGIPTIGDRIIQEIVRLVIEPILEAQFFKHSYGFRPMRDAKHAKQRVEYITFSTENYWVVEGDIKGFFDNINHRILLKQLWNMGICDKRVLLIIKRMLQAGIMDEVNKNEIGTPQGGIISPLLANVYLHKLDKWITREWEEKKTQYDYSSKTKAYRALKKTNLKPAFFVRYADDWVLITNTKKNAMKWKHRIAKYLETNLKIELSMEKTKITNITKKHITFLGFDIKLRKGKWRTGYINSSKPNKERLESKIKDINKNIRKLRDMPSREKTIHQINKINSQVRGVIQYYESASHVSPVLSKYAYRIERLAYTRLIGQGGKWIPSNEVYNLPSVHQDRTQKIPAIEYEGVWIGVTSLSFAKWVKDSPKNPKETEYSEIGRTLFKKRTGKNRRLIERADELLLSEANSYYTSRRNGNNIHNFEFFLNRAYAFNRDKGKCKVCETTLTPINIQTHHINPSLQLEVVNKLPNLASVCDTCHKLIHAKALPNNLPMKQYKKLTNYREKLRN